MATNTTKMALRKPATSDNVNVTTDLSDNFQKLDDTLPTTNCTSGTRPGSPFSGQLILETDTKVYRIWNGTEWRKVLLGDATTDLDSNVGSVQTGFRNYFHNGGVQVCQRGTGSISVGTGASAYTVDGIQLTSGTGATNAHQQITTAMGALTLGSRTQKALLWDRTVAGSTDSFFRAVIEDVNTLNGKTVTVSWEAWTASGSVDYTLNLLQYFGSGGSPSTLVSNTSTAVKTAGTGTVNVRQTATFTLGSMSGKTKGTNGNDALLVEFKRAFNATNGATGQVYFTNIQIEEGSSATPFEYVPYSVELSRCQRYFISVGGDNAYQQVGFGIASSTTQILLSVPFATRMRIIPGVSTPNAALWRVWDGVTATTPSAIAVYSGADSADMGSVLVTVASGLTQYRPYQLQGNNSTVARIYFIAEI